MGQKVSRLTWWGLGRCRDWSGRSSADWCYSTHRQWVDGVSQQTVDLSHKPHSSHFCFKHLILTSCHILYTNTTQCFTHIHLHLNDQLQVNYLLFLYNFHMSEQTLGISGTRFTEWHYASAVHVVVVHPSVRPSVTSQSFTKMAEPRITQTMLCDSQGILVFWCQKSWWHSDGVTPMEAPNTSVVGSDQPFSPNISLHFIKGAR